MAAPLWAAPPPQQQPQQQPRQVKRLRLEEEEQLTYPQQQQQQGFAGDPADAPAAQRRRLDGGGYSAWLPPTLGLQQPPQAQQPLPLQPPFAPLSPPQGLPQQQPQQPAQPAASWSRADTGIADLAPDSCLDSSDSEAEGPARQRRKSGGTEYRLMLPSPLPHAIPLPPAWQQLPLAHHPASLAHAVIPYSPQPPLAELAGRAAQHPSAVGGGGGASSSGMFQQQRQEMAAAAAAAAADGMGFLGPQMRRLHLTFDHERPLPGDLPSPAPTTTFAAPTFVIEELPRAVESGEAMEE